MKKKILIIGGYGNFGSFIAKTLAAENDLEVIVAGRDAVQAKEFAKTIGANWAQLDIHKNLDAKLSELKPDVVIHTSGPFQAQGYDVAQACIGAGTHYIDLADGREFVANIGQLDIAAKNANVLVVSGASSVPCLTSAIMDRYQFPEMEHVDYAITTAQKTNRGLATTRAILSYVGKPFQTLINGTMESIYGWQDLHFHRFEDLGFRPLGNCDVPDLSLFPQRYPQLKTIRFYAGLEITFEHIGLWYLSWLVRVGVIKHLEKAGKFLLGMSRWFDVFGSDRSGFYMRIRGGGKVFMFNLTANGGFGPYIPSMPSIILARRMARGEITHRGAQPCMDLITLDDYLSELKNYPITWSVD